MREELTFGEALEYLKQGFAVARRGWNGKGIYLKLQVPDEHSKMTQPYIYINTLNLETDNPDAPKGRVPWSASQTDMLAEDWYHFEEECVVTEWRDELEGKLGYCADTVEDIMVLPFADEFDDWKLAYYDPDAVYEEEENGGN